MSILLNKGLLQGKCLDYACGIGEDWQILKKKGINIIGYDTYNPKFNNRKLLIDTYDTISNIYMFNVIPSIEEHKRQLKLLKSISNNIYICVRSDIKAIKNTWVYNKEYDGYITNIKSFQRFYNTKEKIKDYFGDVNYISSNFSFKLFKLHI